MRQLDTGAGRKFEALLSSDEQNAAPCPCAYNYRLLNKMDGHGPST
ncbi:hypothetical protein AVEN_127461-1, partial [Araneus ventricosus]